MRQLYTQTLRAAGGDALENALATQARAMLDLRDKLGRVESGPQKQRLSRTVEQINRIFEELVQGLEAGRTKE